MLLAYAILLPGPAHNRVRDLQLAIHHAIGPNPTLRLEPHLTLKQPFPAETVEPFAGDLDALAGQTRAFAIRSTGLGIFDDGVVYLDVVPDSRLAALRQGILRALAPHGVRPEGVEDGRYHFHITLAVGPPAAQRGAALAALSGGDVEFAFVFDTLGMFCSLSAEEWFVYRRAPVGA